MTLSEHMVVDSRCIWSSGKHIHGTWSLRDSNANLKKGFISRIRSHYRRNIRTLHKIIISLHGYDGSKNKEKAVWEGFHFRWLRLENQYLDHSFSSISLSFPKAKSFFFLLNPPKKKAIFNHSWELRAWAEISLDDKFLATWKTNVEKHSDWRWFIKSIFLNRLDQLLFKTIHFLGFGSDLDWGWWPSWYRMLIHIPWCSNCWNTARYWVTSRSCGIWFGIGWKCNRHPLLGISLRSSPSKTKSKLVKELWHQNTSQLWHDFDKPPLACVGFVFLSQTLPQKWGWSCLEDPPSPPDEVHSSIVVDRHQAEIWPETFVVSARVARFSIFGTDWIVLDNLIAWHIPPHIGPVSGVGAWIAETSALGSEIDGPEDSCSQSWDSRCYRVHSRVRHFRSRSSCSVDCWPFDVRLYRHLFPGVGPGHQSEFQSHWNSCPHVACSWLAPMGTNRVTGWHSLGWFFLLVEAVLSMLWCS